VHGHAHRGAAEGKTAAGVPVYNVSLPIMRTNYPGKPPFRLLTLPAVAPTAPLAASDEKPVETKVQ
jgi:hypothetical protein